MFWIAIGILLVISISGGLPLLKSLVDLINEIIKLLISIIEAITNIAKDEPPVETVQEDEVSTQSVQENTPSVQESTPSAWDNFKEELVKKTASRTGNPHLTWNDIKWGLLGRILLILFMPPILFITLIRLFP